MKKILIVYATAGIGHKKAAMAIKKAFDEMATQDVEVSMIDSLDYTNKFFRWVYLEFYLLMVNRLPLLWGFLYYLTDNYYFNILVSKLRRINNWLNSGNLLEYLKANRPDVIISTHFFGTEVISDLKAQGVVASRLINVVTDYRLHAWWICDYVDMYIVGGDDARDDLLRWKVDSRKIMVLGIPAEPVFSKKLDKEKIIGKSNLKRDVFTVLVIGGGFGVGPIEEIVKIIGSIDKPVQMIAVCGHNEQLVKRLEALRPNLKSSINILGFVDNVYEYMEVSDVLISKSGGITVTESLDKEIPMIIISPIIGQETRNSDYLMNHRAALKIDSLSELRGILEGLILHRDKIEFLRKSIGAIRKPTACYDIAKLALE